MTKEELWQHYVDRNPLFGKPEGDVRVSVESLRRLTFQAYEQGKKSGDARKSVLDGMFDGLTK